ncbi:hypothetical protein ACLB1E_32480 [Escherichia coli]
MTVKVQPLAKPSEDELHQAMLNGIRGKGLSVLNWTAEAEQLRLRLLCAGKWLPEYDWPAVDDESLLATPGNVAAATYGRCTFTTRPEITRHLSGTTRIT